MRQTEGEEGVVHLQWKCKPKPTTKKTDPAQANAVHSQQLAEGKHDKQADANIEETDRNPREEAEHVTRHSY